MIAYLTTQSFAQFHFPYLHSPVSEIQPVIVPSTYSLTCAASSELSSIVHFPISVILQLKKKILLVLST